MTEETYYLVKIDEFRKPLASGLGFQRMCGIRMFNDKGGYMFDEAVEREIVIPELVDQDIGFIVQANYDGSKWNYVPRGMGPLSLTD